MRCVGTLPARGITEPLPGGSKSTVGLFCVRRVQEWQNLARGIEPSNLPRPSGKPLVFVSLQWDPLTLVNESKHSGTTVRLGLRALHEPATPAEAVQRWVLR